MIPPYADLSRHGGRAALVCEDETITYAELDRRARQWAHALSELSARVGDRVAAMLPPSIESVAAMLGAYRARLRWVPINHRYPAAEVQHIVSDSRPVVALAVPDLADRIPSTVPIWSIGAAQTQRRLDGVVPPEQHAEAEDGALLIYTSGTTGRSKGVDLSHAAVTSAIGSLTRSWKWSADDRLSLSLPLFHVHGLCIGIHGGLMHGMTTLLHPHFSPNAVVEDFARHDATIFMGVPTMYARLLEHIESAPSAATSLRRGRLFTAGSAALSPDALERFDRATGHRILERYGMSETLLTLSNPHDAERRSGSVGLPIEGVRMRVVSDDGVDVAPGETGELWVQAQGMMTGYFGQPQLTTAAFTDGWFRTADVVRCDSDGYVRILGRRSTDIVKSGGFKIATREIEEVLAEDPDVAEVAVFGAADSLWGERVVAAVVPGAQTAPSKDEWFARMQEATRARLADYKTPRQLLVLPELPRNALGKVLKPRLRELAEAVKPD